MSDAIEPLMKGKEVAAWLGVHINTVKRIGDRGELAFIRLTSRGDRRYRPSDVKEYIRGREQKRGERRHPDS